MGVSVSFARISPADLDRGYDDPEWLMDHLMAVDTTGEPDGYLDKAWAGLQFLLDAEGIDIDLRGGTYDFIGDDGDLVAWSEHSVEEAAKILRATPFDRLARHFDPAEMTRQDIYPGIWQRDDALDYLRHAYRVLVEFFDAAAQARSAAVMQIG
jgi:uncharacterized protein DUF1877